MPRKTKTTATTKRKTGKGRKIKLLGALSATALIGALQYLRYRAYKNAVEKGFDAISKFARAR